MEEKTPNNNQMYVDVHVHSYPTLVSGGTIWPFQGIPLCQLEKILKEKEDSTRVKHGVFYGPHHKQLLKESYEGYWNKLTNKQKDFLITRVAPMIEHHTLQTIGVVNWDSIELLYKFEESGKLKKQVDAVKYIADNQGISIIDIPKKEHDKKKGVYTNLEGAATIDELNRLPDYIKERTFLCYNAMEPTSWRKEAEFMSRETGLKLLGGSDAISSLNSLFCSYSKLHTDDIRKIFKEPGLIKEIKKGPVPFFGEKIRRYFVCGIIEYLIGPDKREKRVRKLLDKRTNRKDYKY